MKPESPLEYKPLKPFYLSTGGNVAQIVSPGTPWPSNAESYTTQPSSFKTTLNTSNKIELQEIDLSMAGVNVSVKLDDELNKLPGNSNGNISFSTSFLVPKMTNDTIENYLLNPFKLSLEMILPDIKVNSLKAHLIKENETSDTININGKIESNTNDILNKILNITDNTNTLSNNTISNHKTHLKSVLNPKHNKTMHLKFVLSVSKNETERIELMLANKLTNAMAMVGMQGVVQNVTSNSSLNNVDNRGKVDVQLDFIVPTLNQN